MAIADAALSITTLGWRQFPNVQADSRSSTDDEDYAA
jgi:hypothetical protein